MEAAALVALVVLAVPTPSIATDAQGDSLAAVLREVTGKFFVFFWGALLCSLVSVQSDSLICSVKEG